MGYAWLITIPADTSEEDPVTEELKLHPGVVTRIGCKFPAGCCNLVKVRLTRGGVFPVFPLSTGEWVTGDDEEVSFPYHYDLTDRPFALKFKGCSPDTSYQHKVTVRITVLPRLVASLMPLYLLLEKVVNKLVTRIFGVTL